VGRPAYRGHGDRDSKANLKNGFLVLYISGALLRARNGPGLSMLGGGVEAQLGRHCAGRAALSGSS